MTTLAAEPAARSALLQQAQALEAGAAALHGQPLRTLHHFACTGGTLISKCIAALPNVQLLSEVDPLSTQLLPEALRFSPTDMVTLARQSTRGASDALVIELFRAQVQVLQQHAVRHGLRLVLRDHAHGHYCHGAALAVRPALREMLPPALPLLSLLTVRHPLDSYASLARNGWVHLQPRTLHTYCQRYLAFLDQHEGLPLLRYEDFVAAPQRAMQLVCEALALRYEPHFARFFAGFAVSGDSGRSGTTIAPRPSHASAVALEAEAAASDAYVQLVQRLGYGLRAGALD
ncbi:hypothetical protein ACPOLB_22770 [Rubrivivax sp. RP6-9]|uniref:hypothetical protein n=1 Tax=Rubrivivax sp. RP6-9 TaxID=3415750 RepID=UPI003CC5D8DA